MWTPGVHGSFFIFITFHLVFLFRDSIHKVRFRNRSGSACRAELSVWRYVESSRAESFWSWPEEHGNSCSILPRVRILFRNRNFLLDRYCCFCCRMYARYNFLGNIWMTSGVLMQQNLKADLFLIRRPWFIIHVTRTAMYVLVFFRLFKPWLCVIEI